MNWLQLEDLAPSRWFEISAFLDCTRFASFSPVHNYTFSNTYNVKLITTSPSILSSSCVDTVTNAVNVIITGVKQIVKIKKNEIKIQTNLVSDKLAIETNEDVQISVFNMLGVELKTIDLKKNVQNEIDIEQLESGMYFISSNKIRPIRFVKAN